jgi:triosephosphate isomerase
VLPLVGTSSKMNLTSSQARAYLLAVRELIEPLTGVDRFVLPPFTSLWVARECLAGSGIAWGAQDVHSEDSGAHTGDISAPMLTDLGCRFVEVGHSERRREHGESDAVVATKVAQVVRHGMTPILCVGENARLAEDATVDFVLGQLEGGMAQLSRADRRKVVVAYEPVWAIGTGARSAGGDHIATIHAAIHGFLRSFGETSDVPVIYGGSVDPGNAEAILSSPGVDGLFVGRAALDPSGFAAIVTVALRAAEVQDRWRT